MKSFTIRDKLQTKTRYILHPTLHASQPYKSINQYSTLLNGIMNPGLKWRRKKSQYSTGGTCTASGLARRLNELLFPEELVLPTRQTRRPPSLISAGWKRLLLLAGVEPFVTLVLFNRTGADMKQQVSNSCPADADESLGKLCLPTK